MSILQLLFSLAILVFIHELGHFTMARIFGVRVEKFYLFFNPWFSLFKYKGKKSGTVYGLGWLPLGGYCQLAGMVDESLDEDKVKGEAKPDDFRAKKAYQRLLIMAGGILFNILLAFAIYIAVSYHWGQDYLASKDIRSGWVFTEEAKKIGFQDGDIILSVDGDSLLNVLDNSLMNKILKAKVVSVERAGQQINLTMPEDLTYELIKANSRFGHVAMPFVIDSVLPNSLAEGKLQKNDRVVAVNGKACSDIESVMQSLAEYKGREISLSFERKLSSCDSIITESFALDSTARIGVVLRSPQTMFKISRLDYSFCQAVVAGLERAGMTASAYASSLKYVFTKEGVQQMGGFATMAKLYSNEFDWRGFWHTTAFLSIILAIMNLLPIPALDGGHIMLLLYEIVTGRKVSDKVMMKIQMVGVMLLLTLMLYANGNDIYRFFLK